MIPFIYKVLEQVQLIYNDRNQISGFQNGRGETGYKGEGVLSGVTEMFDILSEAVVISVYTFVETHLCT